VHRWRYAQVMQRQAGQAPGPAAADACCQWDGQAGLGACGDHLGAGGIEAAWLSGQALARKMLVCS
jgi:predicted NAD/FAD-dependent oxidoreductase